MTATSALPTSPPTTDVRECSACRQPLGSASRYCLHCGARQGPVPLELVGLASPTVAAGSARTAGPAGLAAAAGPPAAPATVPPPAPATVLPAAASGAAAGRGWPFALTAVVLLALVIGLLAGGLLADRYDDPGSGSGTAISTAAPASAPAEAAPAPTAPAPTAPAGAATGAGE